MELPRRRTGTYEPRSAVGNILAPTSGPHGSAELRITPPPSRGNTAATSISRPPWATELDDPGPAPSLPARASSASRQKVVKESQLASEARDFSFDSLPIHKASKQHNSAGGSASASFGASWNEGPSWDSHRPPSQPAGRLQSGTRVAPTDQLDIWAQQQPQNLNLHNHQPPTPLTTDPTVSERQRSEGRPSGPRHSAAMVTATPAPARGGSGRNGNVTSARLAPGELSSADAIGSGSGGGGGAAAARASRAGGNGSGGGTTPGRIGRTTAVAAAPSARTAAVSSGITDAATSTGQAAPAVGRGAVRSTSTPKPRPVAPPKRSTSITENVRRDWVEADVTPAGRGGGSAGAGSGAGRWDSECEDADRGSWLFVNEAATAVTPVASQPPSLGQGPRGNVRRVAVAVGNPHDEQPVGAAAAARRPPPPPRSSERPHPNDAGAADSSDDDNDRACGGGGADQVQRSPPPSRNMPPPLARRNHPPPPPSDAAGGGLEATFAPYSPPGVAGATRVVGAAAMIGGVGGGGSAMALGHGISVGYGASDIGSGGGVSGPSRGGVTRGSRPTAESTRELQSQLQVLQDENTWLRGEVEHLRRLLEVAGAGAGEAAGAGGMPGGASSSRRGGGAVGSSTTRPFSAGTGTGTAGGSEGGPSMAAAAAAGGVLRQYKSQVIQLQRQVALMSVELESKSRLALEAEGILLQTASWLQDFAGASGPDHAAADGLDEPLSRDRLLQLHKWSKQMLNRLRSEKSQASRLFTATALQEAATATGHGTIPTPSTPSGPTPGPSWSNPTPRAPFNANPPHGIPSMAPPEGPLAPSWLVPFIPAASNPFLMQPAGAATAAGGTADPTTAASAPISTHLYPPGPSFTPSINVVALSCGRGVLLADPAATHRLEQQLAALAPRLAGLAVLLRGQLLPAMPWLGTEAADRLQVEVGEAAEVVGQAAGALVQLCALLPAGAAVFGSAPAGAEPRSRAAEVEAGRDAWLYSSPQLVEGAEPPSPCVDGEGLLHVDRLQASLLPLLRDRKSSGRTLSSLIEPLRVAAQSSASKRAVLECELRFAARCAALHSEHVSHLMANVGLALQECRGAKDVAVIKSYFAAAAAVRQVLEAADGLEAHPCEDCLKALVEVIRLHRGHLDRVPDMMVSSPAADVEGRLLSKVEELHAGFRKALSRLEAHKRRLAAGQQPGTAGGEGGASGAVWEEGDKEGSDTEGCATATSEDQQMGPLGVVVAIRAGGSSRGGTGGAGSGAGNADVSKPVGKPPKPKPEWQ